MPETVPLSPTELLSLLKETAQLANIAFEHNTWPQIEVEENSLILESCVFRMVDFSAAIMENLTASNCIFDACNFSSAILKGSVFDNCKFYNRSTEQGCKFMFANAEQAIFKRCDLSLSNFSRATLYAVEMQDCQLQGADLSAASFCHVISSNVELISASLLDSNFAYADLSGVTLSDCNLSGSRFSHACFDNAVLHNTDLSDTDLTAISAQFLDISGADLRNAQFNNLDLRQINATGVKIMPWQQSMLLEIMGLIVCDE